MFDVPSPRQSLNYFTFNILITDCRHSGSRIVWHPFPIARKLSHVHCKQQNQQEGVNNTDCRELPLEIFYFYFLFQDTKIVEKCAPRQGRLSMHIEIIDPTLKLSMLIIAVQ